MLIDEKDTSRGELWAIYNAVEENLYLVEFVYVSYTNAISKGKSTVESLYSLFDGAFIYIIYSRS